MHKKTTRAHSLKLDRETLMRLEESELAKRVVGGILIAPSLQVLCPSVFCPP